MARSTMPAPIPAKDPPAEKKPPPRYDRATFAPPAVPASGIPEDASSDGS
ncbi:hypothetical protein ABH945_001262 [Paraburkholderia sp. GAS333]